MGEKKKSKLRGRKHPNKTSLNMVEHHLLQERWIDPTNEDPNLLPSGKLNQSRQEIRKVQI